MNTFKRNKRYNLIAICVLLICFEGRPQIARSIYFFDHLPAAGYLNPSFMPSREVYLGLPVISKTAIMLDMPLSYDNFMKKNESEGFTYIDRQAVMESLKDVNMLSLDFQTVISQLNIRSERNAFSLSISKVFSANVMLEKDLIGFLLYGNASEEYLGKELYLNKTGLNTTLYNEVAVGFARDISQKFSIGSRLKYLNGYANMNTNNSSLRLHTDEATYAITATADININYSFPVDPFDSDNDVDFTQYIWMQFTGNHGFGFDIGATYYFRPHLRFSGSISDIGRIKWKQNVTNIRSEHPGRPYTFEGLDINDYFTDGKFNDEIKLLDSLADHFALEKVHEAYITRLVPKTYLAAVYDFTPRDQAGMLFRVAYYEGFTGYSITGNYKRRIGNVLSLQGNYTFSNQRDMFGVGLAFEAGPVQFYAVPEVTTSFYNLQSVRRVFFQFGFGINLGRNMDYDMIPEDIIDVIPEAVEKTEE